MGEFYITKVVAKGSGKTDSVIDLRPGLNIIRGRSNTGKTCIIKCIDFCFGSKAKPFDESLGYDTIEISLHTGKGDITITRALGKNQVDVVTDVPGFESGKYDLKHTNKKDPLPILSDLLLDSIGIEGEHFVIKNKNFEKKRLTWRTFLHVLLFHVADIAKEKIINGSTVPEKCVYGDMKDIVTPDAPEDIYISPVGCYGIVRRKIERNTSINPRLEEVLLSISSQMSAEEIEKRSRIQHRGRFSDNPVRNPQTALEEPSTEKCLSPSGKTKTAMDGDPTQLSLFDLMG